MQEVKYLNRNYHRVKKYVLHRVHKYSRQRRGLLGSWRSPLRVPSMRKGNFTCKGNTDYKLLVESDFVCAQAPRQFP